MEDVWQKVQQASHDPALLSFLQHLLTQDPLQRSSGALICQHPFLHMPDTTLVPSHPSQPVVSFLSGRPDESQLQQVPGMPDVFWQPAKPLGIAGTGTINWYASLPLLPFGPLPLPCLPVLLPTHSLLFRLLRYACYCQQSPEEQDFTKHVRL